MERVGGDVVRLTPTFFFGAIWDGLSAGVSSSDRSMKDILEPEKIEFAVRLAEVDGAPSCLSNSS